MFNMTLTANLTNELVIKIYNAEDDLIKIFADNNQSVKSIVFEKISLGSVIISGIIVPEVASVSSVQVYSDSLLTSLKNPSTTIAGFSILSATVTPSVSIPPTVCEVNCYTNTNLIIGLSVGIPLFLSIYDVS